MSNPVETHEQKVARFEALANKIKALGVLQDAKDCAETNDIAGLIFICNMAEEKRGSDSRLLIESIAFGQFLVATY